MSAPPSPAIAASPAGFAAILAALGASAFAAALTLFISELLRITSTELRERVFTPRVTRRLQKRREQGDGLAPDAVPAVPSRAPFAWVRPVWRTRDEQLLPEVGLDAIFFLKFARLGLHVCLVSAVFDLSAVLWANIEGAQDIPNASDMDRFTIGHVAPTATALWVHFASVCLKTVLVLILLYRLSLWVAGAQDRAAAERLHRPEGKAVLVSDVPGGADAARAAFAALYPGAFVAAVAAVDPRPTAALAAEREALVRRLEDARWAWDHSKRIEGSGGITLGRRPTHRTGFLGVVGPRVDSLEAYGAALADVEARLEAARAALLAGAPTEDAPGRSAAFVTFATPRQAAVAAQVLVSRDPFIWRLAPAPPPADIFWPNVGRMPPLLRQAAGYITALALYSLVVFYMIPIAAISALSTLSNLSRLLPFLKPLVESPVVRSVLEGLLPGLALIVFMALLPGIVRALAAARGVRTHSGLDSAELRGMFLFAVINVFLGNVLAGSVFSGLKSMIDNPPGIFGLLATTVPQTSRFFISFIALKALGGAASEVSCVVKCVMYLLHTRVLGARRTPRREAAAWAPHASALGSDLSDILLVLLLVIIFSTIAPLVHLVGLLYFALRLGAAKASIMYRHEAAHEGAAAVWSPARGRVGAALLVYQATLAGVFALKRAPVPAALLIGAAMPLTLAAVRALGERFDPCRVGKAPPPLGWFAPAPPGEEAVVMVPSSASARSNKEDDAAGVAAEPDAVAAAFLPPALQPLPEAEARELVRLVRDVDATPLERTRSTNLIAAATEDEEDWHEARTEQ